ncbi:hypothetical protein NL676_025712 [Syzygium grande]|nr:hypothetical protein NL676_025712 [Syzygium grande]
MDGSQDAFDVATTKKGIEELWEKTTRLAMTHGPRAATVIGTRKEKAVGAGALLRKTMTVLETWQRSALESPSNRTIFSSVHV